MKKQKALLIILLGILIVGILLILVKEVFNYKKNIEPPLILQIGWDELVFVGSPSPVDNSWMVVSGVKKVIKFEELLRAIKKGFGNELLGKLDKSKIIGVTDEGGFARSALFVLRTRKNGLKNIFRVNGNAFKIKKKVSHTSLEEIKVNTFSNSGADLKEIDFDKYVLVLEPFENMLGSGDVLIYLAAQIDKTKDTFSGLISNWRGKVCDIYLGDITNEDGFDYEKFDKKLRECFEYPVNKIYFWYPKYWRRSAVPILFLKNSQYFENQK